MYAPKTENPFLTQIVRRLEWKSEKKTHTHTTPVYRILS